jgi:hypothetical protein
MNNNLELYHYGVKGMKWGVRRYQNTDGSLTPAGKARQLKDDYKNVGASKDLARRHADFRKRTEILRNDVQAAIDRIEKNEYTSKQAKKLAKDYSTALNGLKKLAGSERVSGRVDVDAYNDNVDKLKKLKQKKQTEITRKKIDELVTDNKLMELKLNTVYDNSRIDAYKRATNHLLDKLGKDNRVVYTTKEGSTSNIQSIDTNLYEYATRGTQYSIKANTKTRSNSKKYSDPDNKKEYEDELVKYQYQYCYY